MPVILKEKFLQTYNMSHSETFKRTISHDVIVALIILCAYEQVVTANHNRFS